MFDLKNRLYIIILCKDKIMCLDKDSIPFCDINDYSDLFKTCVSTIKNLFGLTFKEEQFLILDSLYQKYIDNNIYTILCLDYIPEIYTDLEPIYLDLNEINFIPTYVKERIKTILWSYEIKKEKSIK